VPHDVSLDNIEVTSAQVLKAIKRTRSKRSLGLNGFSSDFVKKLGNSLIKPLCVLLNYVFNSGQIPDDWRDANVMPIFKKGSSTACSSYSPISLTLCFCKLSDRIMKESVLDYLLKNNLLCCHQHVFFSESSTCTQFLECINDWLLGISNWRFTDIIYFYFSVAFDSVS